MAPLDGGFGLCILQPPFEGPPLETSKPDTIRRLACTRDDMIAANYTR